MMKVTPSSLRPRDRETEMTDGTRGQKRCFCLPCHSWVPLTPLCIMRDSVRSAEHFRRGCRRDRGRFAEWLPHFECCSCLVDTLDSLKYQQTGEAEGWRFRSSQYPHPEMSDMLDNEQVFHWISCSTAQYPDLICTLGKLFISGSAQVSIFPKSVDLIEAELCADGASSR